MSILNAVAFADIRARGSIQDGDVQKLRATFYDDGSITRDEAEELFALNEACPVQAPSWPGFFIEAITDYTVNQERPDGYLTAANAAWLLKRISADGVVETKTELELLITIIDRSRWSPASLVKFALSQVKAAVLKGTGPSRTGAKLQAGIVMSEDVTMIRRILYAFGGDGANAITRAEAEILFDINDATAQAENAPEWSDLFVKAIANAIMAASGYRPPSRQEALRRVEWLERGADLSLSGTLERIGKGFSVFFKGYQLQGSEERAISRLEQQKIEIITNEQVTEGEAGWLAERIGRDGELHENEKALLQFISAHSPQIHPALDDLIARAAKAA